MRPGRLRHTLTIKTATVTRSPSGAEILTTSTFDTRKCEPLPASSVELVVSEQVVNESVIRWRMRYLPGVTSKMTAIYKSSTYNITGVENVRGENKETIITGQLVV